MEWTSFNACPADKLHPPTTSLHRKVARLQRLMDLRAIGAPLGRREQTVGAAIGEPAQWAGGLSKLIPQTEMGAGIAASPHLHRAKDLPVFASLVAFAPRSSILAHQLRRRFQSWSSPRAGSRPSAALLGLVPFASPAPRGSRELRLEDQLFRRLFRWSDLGRSPPHRHPVEIGPSVTCRTFLPLPAFQ
jgi:hypothetical protein